MAALFICSSVMPYCFEYLNVIIAYAPASVKPDKDSSWLIKADEIFAMSFVGTSVIFSTPITNAILLFPAIMEFAACNTAKEPLSPPIWTEFFIPNSSEHNALMLFWSEMIPEKQFATNNESTSFSSKSADFTAFIEASLIKSLNPYSQSSPNLVEDAPIIKGAAILFLLIYFILLVNLQ